MAGYPPERANCPSDPSIYPDEYYKQGIREYSGQDKTDPITDGITGALSGGILTGLSGAIKEPLGTAGYYPVGFPVQKLDILEAAKRKLIKSLVERSQHHNIPEAYYSGLLDLVREYDSEWASFYDSISGAGSPYQNQMSVQEQKRLNESYAQQAELKLRNELDQQIAKRLY